MMFRGSLNWFKKFGEGLESMHPQEAEELIEKTSRIWLKRM
jgi:hypothetical protein